MLTKTSKGYKTEALKTNAEYHAENHQSPQHVDILYVTYVTMGRIIWQRQVLMRHCISYYKNIMLKIRIHFTCTLSRLHLA